MDIKILIEKLIRYGVDKNILKSMDEIVVRNSLMDIFKVDSPYEGSVKLTKEDTINNILSFMCDYAYENGLIEENTVTFRDLFDTRLMGLLMPRQSEVSEKFESIEKNYSIKKATDYFYELSKDSNYIRMDRIKKNHYWEVQSKYGNIEITVNLSKPEKDPKAIAKAREVKSSGYPKCFLCLENIGYPGKVNHPARQNHRVIKTSLIGENWYFQYSPYVYYNEHSIIFNENHVPMKISKKSFERLLDFVERFDHYFIGSNADLPIVGGSILSHDHFQGGNHVFPMEKASVIKTFINEKYKDMEIDIVKWPLSCIRLTSKSKRDIASYAEEILYSWSNYSDEKVNILSHTKNGNDLIRHNTVTPIARRSRDNKYQMDIVLRNNRTTDEFPDGIFHPHKNLHHIKKENIGLIEVMGLAVLPGRLDLELSQIKEVLLGKQDFDLLKSSLDKHKSWIDKMKDEIKDFDNLDLDKYLKNQVGEIFVRVLEDAGVFKMNDIGIQAFIRFIKNTGNIKEV